MNTKSTFLLIVVATAMLFSCKKESEPDKEGIVKEKIEIVIPQEYVDTLESLGMIIHVGSNPPNVEGIYDMNDLIMENFNYPGDEIGRPFQDEKLKLSNQNNDEFTIDSETKSATSSSISENTVVTGNGNNFTVWGNFTKTSVNDTVEFAVVISGTISTEGINNLKYALVNVNYIKNVSGIFIKEGQAQLINNSGLVAARTGSFEFRMTNGIVGRNTNNLKPVGAK